MAVKPSQIPNAVLALHDAVAKKVGGASVGASAMEGVGGMVEKCAAELAAAKGKSLVICGHNDEGTQVIVNSINAMLGNYGSTIDLANHTYFKQGDDAAVQQLVKDMNAGTVGAVLIAGVNPVYSLPNAAEFAAGLKKVKLSVSFSSHADETASLCSMLLPDSHWLESWNDYMPKPGHYATAQPAIRPLYDTRQWPETLLKWSGIDKNYHAHIQEVWQACPQRPFRLSRSNFSDAWNNSVHNGGFEAYASDPRGGELRWRRRRCSGQCEEQHGRCRCLGSAAVHQGEHRQRSACQQPLVAGDARPAHESDLGQLRMHGSGRPA